MNSKVFRIIPLLLILILIVFSTSCNTTPEIEYPWEIGEESTYTFADNDVRLILNEEKLTPSGGTFYFENNSDETVYDSTPFYEIEININGKWHKIPPDIESRPPHGTGIMSNAFAIYTMDWTSPYGELPTGTYRIVTSYAFDDNDSADIFYVCCEFSIN